MAGEGPIQPPVLMLEPRVCVYRQADNVRRLRTGAPGLTTTNEALDAIGVGVPGQRSLRPVLAAACPDLIDLERSPRALDAFVASNELLRRMKEARANTTFVVEIDAQLICAPRRRGWPGEPCFEEEVRVTALLFDGAGKIVRGATARISDGDKAVAVARAVLPKSFPAVVGTETAPAPPPQPCRVVDDHLDCT